MNYSISLNYTLFSCFDLQKIILNSQKLFLNLFPQTKPINIKLFYIYEKVLIYRNSYILLKQNYHYRYLGKIK